MIPVNNLKCTIIGDGAVGKTCLIMSYTTNKFPKVYIPTVIEKTTFNITFDDKIYNFELFDTAGQEDFDKLRLLAYPKTDVFLVCFNVVKRASFLNVEHKWVPEISQYYPNTPFLIIGTQIDLKENTKILNESETISTQQGEKLAKELKAVKYMECSTLTQVFFASFLFLNLLFNF